MADNSRTTRLAGNWKHLFICPDRTLFQNVTTILAEITPSAPLIDLKNYPNHRAITEVVGKQRPNLCFLDVGSNTDNALAVISDINQVSPGVPVIAVHTSNDPNLILRCLRQGAREFLYNPFTLEQFHGALERLSRTVFRNDAGPAEGGKVYCVMPGKGASGATTIACALAFQLHRSAKKDQQKILLADLDPNTGTISFLLKLKNNFSFIDALANSHHIDADIWKGLVTPCQGIDVVLSPENPVEGVAETYDSYPIIEYSRQAYSNIVLDSRSPYGEWGLSLARACDELILVTTNELPTLHATQKSLAHLDRNGIDRAKIRLVVNRYNSEAGLGREAIETALNQDVFDVLPNDYETIQRSLLDGKPVAPNTSFGKAIAKMAERLSGKAVQAKRQSVLSGIFSMFESKI
jgi:pilus assembly protein CpaE